MMSTILRLSHFKLVEKFPKGERDNLHLDPYIRSVLDFWPSEIFLAPSCPPHPHPITYRLVPPLQHAMFQRDWKAACYHNSLILNWKKLYEWRSTSNSPPISHGYATPFPVYKFKLAHNSEARLFPAYAILETCNANDLQSHFLKSPLAKPIRQRMLSKSLSQLRSQLNTPSPPPSYYGNILKGYNPNKYPAFRSFSQAVKLTMETAAI